MANYMFRTRYTRSGLEGLLREGGTGRREALRQTIEGMGGKLEGFYYAMGDDDLIAAAGALEVSTTVLISPETIDEAVNKSVSYRLPGE